MTENTPVVPVILCGGAGTRLWPLSRKSYPKQFARFLGARSLFQQAAERMAGPGFAPPVIVAGSAFRFLVTEQLAALELAPGALLIEPEARNTAPAVLAAALVLAQDDPEAVMLVAPSDHIVSDHAAFARAVEAGRAGLEHGKIVTFGITPDRAETGYGYLELASRPEGAQLRDLVRFVEKPDAARARDMLEAGTYLWNAGLFMARAADLIAAFRAHAPDLLEPVTQAVAQAQLDLGFLRLDPASFARAPSISLDYAVMEKADNLAVVPFAEGWSDLGDWDSVWRAQPKDAQGVASTGLTEAIDCSGSLLRVEGDGQVLIGIGLEDMIAVAMPDAVLVAPRSRAQDVRRAVDLLKAREIAQAETLPRDYRPWGWYETLVLGPRFQVKRIVVHPGAALSLQSHHHRAEHWIVVEGTAKITVAEETRLISENQSVYIPLGAVHRLENPGKLPMVLIEVQTGSYLGEDDIIRYEDLYARGQGARG